MNVLVVQPPRPDLGQGGSIVIGDLSQKELGNVIHGLSVMLSFRMFRDHYGPLVGPLRALRDGLKEIDDSGAFRPPVVVSADTPQDGQA